MRGRISKMGLLVIAVGLGLVVAAAADENASKPDVQPRPSGLVERTGRQLVQLDVTVSGPEEVIANLTRDDFELVVGGRPIDEFLVDRLCRNPGARAQAAATQHDVTTPEAARTAGPVPPPRAPTTYLFYFDQHLLTAAGRQRSLDMTRRLVPELIRDGDRGMIVSAGLELATVAKLTDDPQVLLDALDGLERDRRQWDPYPYQEELRIRDILKAIYDSDMDHAVALARGFQREERFHTEKALRIFGATIGRLSQTDPPKVALYFADIMRRNAGEHYLSFFSQRQEHDNAAIRAGKMDAFSASSPFDRAIEEAAAHGVRVYTVQAEGLVGESSLIASTPRNQSNRQRVRDAQNSLVGMALESGGRGFINGVPASKMVQRILSDMACLYLLSFEAGDLKRDSPLPVRVVPRPRDVEAQVRGTLVIQSESRRQTSRLLTAFASPRHHAHRSSTFTWRRHPDRLRRRRLTARWSRSRSPARPFPARAGTSAPPSSPAGKVREDASGQITVSAASVPVVFEREMRFAPGPYELIFVASESGTKQVGQRQLGRCLAGEKRGPGVDRTDRRRPAGRRCLLPRRRRARRRRAGGARGEAGPARTGRRRLSRWSVAVAPTRRPGVSSAGSAGDSSAAFPEMELDLKEERCAQIRDLIPTGTMTAGQFRYTVRVIDGDERGRRKQPAVHRARPGADRRGSSPPAQPVSELRD